MLRCPQINMNTTHKPPASRLHSISAARSHWTASRIVGCAVGIAVHLLFAFTVCHLFWFLQVGGTAVVGSSMLLNVVLALQFAVPHSLLLHPAVRKRLSRLIPPVFYGLFYTTVTCVSLLVVFAWWTPIEPKLWEATGALRWVVEAGFLLSWAALFYSLQLTGRGFQTGLTPWLAWVRRQPPPRREFSPRGAYLLIRHPVYLSFMGLVWFTPTMTLDHAVLTGIWTAYLFVGSWLKDRRLEYYLGESYRHYETQVIGYPLALFGPLGKRRFDNESGDPETRVASQRAA